MRRRPGIARTLSERSRQGSQMGSQPGDAAEAASVLRGAMIGGDLGKLLGRLADVVSNAAAAPGGEGDATKGERRIEIGGREGRLVFGYSVRVGLDGAEGAPFGHVAPGAASPSPDAARQPIVDVIEEDDAIVIVAEVPGVSENDVTVTVDGANVLRIATPPPARYAHSIALPAAVDEARLTKSCRNGILEIRLPRRDGAGA